MTAERIELPTKAEIAAMTDPAAVRNLIETVEAVVTTIETRLAYSGINDDDWRGRAQGALIRHRNALKQLGRRAHELRFPPKSAARLHDKKAKAKAKLENVRPDDENDPLTNEALNADHTVNLSAITDLAQADAELAKLEPRIAAVARDRDDEIAMPSAKRDEGFLAATKSALGAMRNSRSVLQTHRNRILRGTAGTSLEAKLARQAHRERLFIDTARDLLPPATFTALWDRVDRLEIEAAGTELAA